MDDDGEKNGDLARLLARQIVLANLEPRVMWSQWLLGFGTGVVVGMAITAMCFWLVIEFAR